MAATLVALPLALYLLKPVVRWLDFTYFHEEIRDHIGQLVSNEDWEKASPLPNGLDKSWLVASKGAGFRYIAHALGEGGRPTANTYAAFAEAKRRGFRLFEVDISLDDEGRLRCHHGPEPMQPYDPVSSCTLNRLLPLIDAANGWVILDIKTDFYQTAAQILDVAKELGLQRRLVFQLYSPDELGWFGRMARTRPLPLPIVTVYNSRRSANHIARHAGSLGIEVLTVPADKINSLTIAKESFHLFTHPVHDCADWERIRHDIPVEGIYAIESTDIRKCNPRQN